MNYSDRLLVSRSVIFFTNLYYATLIDIYYLHGVNVIE